MKVRILESVRANIAGKSMQLEAGELVEVSDAEADMLVRAGVAELEGKHTPAVKVADRADRSSRAAIKRSVPLEGERGE